MARIAIVGRVGVSVEQLEAAGHEPVLDPTPDDAVRACEILLIHADRLRSWVHALHAAGSRLPILACVADGAGAVRALAAGAHDVIRADDPPQLVLTRIQVHLEGTARRRELVIQRARQVEARAAAADLAAEVHRLRELLDGILSLAPLGILALDPALKLVARNEALESMLGFPIDPDQESVQFGDLLQRPEDAEQLARSIQESDSNRVDGVRLVLRGRGGAPVPTLGSALLLTDRRGRPSILLLVLEDQREKEAAERRMEELSRRLVASSSSSRRGRETLQATAHELNQPLTSVMASLEMLRLREDIDQGMADRIDRAYGQLERMAETVRSMMDGRIP